MRKRIFGCIVVLSFAAVVSGGCAKKDMVKTEEQVPSSQTVPPATAQPDSFKSQQQTPTVRGPIAETPTKEALVQPEPAKENVTGAASALESELQKIYFNFDSDVLSEESRAILSKNAELLAKQPAVKLQIAGNCDERGSDEYNLALGERRAKAARDYLVNLGIQPDRLSVISYGEEKPVDPGHDEAAWAKNRRDDFVIIK
jgi:peptidoglycan-associated lipoprotein